LKRQEQLTIIHGIDNYILGKAFTVYYARQDVISGEKQIDAEKVSDFGLAGK
jgi:hypothetical protein